MSDILRTAEAMAEAVKILARDKNYLRALEVHHEGPGGRCASCSQRRPCTIASLAVAARGQAQANARKAAHVDAKVAAALTPTEDAPDPRKPATEPAGEAS